MWSALLIVVADGEVIYIVKDMKVALSET